MARAPAATPAAKKPAATTASNEQIIGTWLNNFFRAHGFSAAQAAKAEAGALGNLQVESTFNPKAYNPNEGALGIAQWEGGRGPNGALGRYATSHHLAADSLAAQLGYLGQELSGPYSHTVAALKTAPSASAAALDWATYFEGNAPASNPQRQANATAIYADLAGGRPLTQGPSTSTATLTAAHTPWWDPSILIPGVGPAIIGGGILSGGSPGDVISGAAGDVAKSVTSGIVEGVKVLTHPLVAFLINALLVVVGIVGLAVALVMIAHSDDAPNTPPPVVLGKGGGAGEAEAAAA